MVVTYSVRAFSSRWGMMVALVLAAASCTLQIGYGAAAILMSAHVNDHRAAWLHPVSGVARSLVPPALVDPSLLQPTPPDESDLLESRGFSPADFAHLVNQKSESGEPMYVHLWFTFNAVAANVLSFLAVFFLFSVDLLKAWEGVMEGFICCGSCKRSCSQPVVDKLELARYHLTRINVMYNLGAEGLSHVVTLPYLCPVPCSPSVMVGYLGTLGLTISFIKVFEGIIHKMSLSIKESRAQGRRAWQVADSTREGGGNAGIVVTRREQVVRLTQISLATARAAQSGVQFVKTYAPYMTDYAMLGVSLTISFATFPVQPYGMAVGLVGVLVKDLLPKVEEELLENVPEELVEAEGVVKEEDFSYWLSERKLEAFSWMIKVRTMSDRAGDFKGYIGKLKMVVRQVVGQDTLGCCGDTSIQALDVMRIVDPLLDQMQASITDYAQDLNLLSGALQRYSATGDLSEEKEVQELLKTIRLLLPKRLTSNFVKKVPCDLLGQLLDMMERSKAAGARELTLEEDLSTGVELQRRRWFSKQGQQPQQSSYKPLVGGGDVESSGK